MANKEICYKFLVENKTEHSNMLAEHGLSIFIEADGKKILFDAGASDILLHNAEVMNVDLAEVDFAVVSHGHYDHTGGFPAFCALNKKASIYLHKDGFRDSYGFRDGQPEDETSGIIWTDEQKAGIKERLELTDGPVYVTENICITGTVPVAEGTNITENFYYRDEEGQWQKDDMSHEQVLVIRQPEGLYIFSGCSHRGVISALEGGKAMFPGERVAVLVAGMHLYSASEEDRKAVVDQMAAEGLDKVMPVHCTGIKAICDLKTKLGENCVVAVAGDVYHGC